MRKLRVGGALPRLGHRHIDRSQQLVLAERGCHHVFKEDGRIDGSGALWSRQIEARPQCREHRREIGGRVGMRDIAADGATVAHGRVADLAGGIGQRRGVALQVV